MGTKEFRREVICPSVEDFAKKYPQYAPFAMSEGYELFNLLTNPESFVKMAAVSDLGLAALYGIAESCSELAQSQNKPLTNFTKQYIGAVVCCLMENNGYKENRSQKINQSPRFYQRGNIFTRKQLNYQRNRYAYIWQK